jgi:hypothetical protein
MFGKGKTVPTWLENKSYAALTNWLLTNPDIAHITSFASCKPPYFIAQQALIMYSLLQALGATTI